ncbi:MAG: hypothetical protein HYR51_17970 [Candidatus Rokubacteria bacterium]|nr:hypothetical protein [Candidatus Rokubacteria bacterium]
MPQHNTEAYKPMKRMAGLLAISLLLGACATQQRAEEAWSPAAMVRVHQARCEHQASVAAPSVTWWGSPSAAGSGSFDTDRDIRRTAYYNCLREWP